MSTSNPTSTLDIELGPGRPPLLTVDGVDDGASWMAENRGALREAVADHGALLIRGLDLGTEAEVGAAAGQLTNDLMIDQEAFAARESHPTGIYSSSAWPPNQQMCMHHELSYRLEFPGLMMFACLVAPASGGSIALADSPTVLEELPADLVERFEQEGWMLVRNYTDEIGLSVEEAFGTDDRAAIESYCGANAIDFEWQADGGLRTRQRRSAVVHHPVTGHRCWFNQIAFLNEFTMNPEVREFLVDMYGPEGLPFNTRTGSGDPIGEEVVQIVNDAYESHAVREPLQAGDLILVDNIRTAHSRDPFEGDRRVLVAMGDKVNLADLSAVAEMSTG